LGVGERVFFLFPLSSFFSFLSFPLFSSWGSVLRQVGQVVFLPPARLHPRRLTVIFLFLFFFLSFLFVGKILNDDGIFFFFFPFFSFLSSAGCQRHESLTGYIGGFFFLFFSFSPFFFFFGLSGPVRQVLAGKAFAGRDFGRILPFSSLLPLRPGGPKLFFSLCHFLLTPAPSRPRPGGSSIFFWTSFFFPPLFFSSFFLCVDGRIGGSSFRPLFFFPPPPPRNCGHLCRFHHFLFLFFFPPRRASSTRFSFFFFSFRHASKSEGARNRTRASSPRFLSFFFFSLTFPPVPLLPARE